MSRGDRDRGKAVLACCRYGGPVTHEMTNRTGSIRGGMVMSTLPSKEEMAALSEWLPVTGKRGKLLNCPNCDARWYLDAAKFSLFRVEPGLEPLLTAWAAEPQRPAPEIMSALESIGGTRRKHFMPRGDTLSFPGRGRTRDGRELPRCVLRFQQFAPLASGVGEVLLASELASLEPSPEVLPPVVRQVTTIEWESGRGLALTPVVTPDGKGLYLNWTVYFFAARGVLGKDLDLTTQKVRFSRKRIYAEAKDQITLVVADWDEDLLRLCPPMPEEGLPEDWMKLGWRSWS